jgi:tight adherence protein C
MALDATSRGTARVTAVAVALTVAAVVGVGAAGQRRLPPVRRAVRNRPADAERAPAPGWAIGLALCLVIVAATVVGGPLLPAVVVAVAGAARTGRAAGRARRRRRAAERALPDTVDLLVHTVQAGLTPRHGIQYLATHGPIATRPAFAEVVLRTERGSTLADSLTALTDRLGPAAGPVADAIAASERFGLPLAPVLDELARDARDARRRHDEADARRLPVRLAFPLVACTLPSFVLLAVAPAVIAALSSLGTSTW